MKTRLNLGYLYPRLFWHHAYPRTCADQISFICEKNAVYQFYAPVLAEDPSFSTFEVSRHRIGINILSLLRRTNVLMGTVPLRVSEPEMI